MVFSVILTSEMVGMYFMYEYKNTLTEKISGDSERLNSAMVNKIDSYATERLVDTIYAASDSSFKSAADLSNIQFSNMTDAEQFIDKTDAAWTSAPQQEITPFMKTLIDNQYSKQLRQISDSEDILFNGKVYREIFITNAYGANIAQTDKTTDYRQSDEVWWQEAKKNGVYIGGIELDNSSGNISFAVAKRMDDENGNFLGVIKAVVNIGQIINIIKTQMTQSSGINPTEYELVSADGHVLYSTDSQEKPFSANNTESEYLNEMNDFSGHFSYTDPNSDETYLVTYSHSHSSKISPLFNWIFITKYKSSELLEPVTRLSNYMLVIMFSLIIGVSILVFIASNRIVRPIETIQSAMTDYTNGKITEIKSIGSNEMDSLITHFNKMIKTEETNKIKIIESENLYKGLFELSPDPIRISTLDLIIIDVNQSFLDKFGYSREEIVGKPIFETIEDSSRKMVDTVLESLKKGDHVENIEMLYHKKDGTKIPILLSLSLSRDQGGKPSGYIAIIKDVSEIYEARMKIHESEEKILNQYLKLRQIDELKDEFASMISHELSTPLFPIKFHSEMLKDPNIFGKLNKEQLNSVNEIYENSIKLDKLINDILDVQKLEQNGLKFTKINFKIDEFMSKIYDNSKTMMEGKSIKFENSTKEGIIINSDPSRLEQVFSNLIKNAVDFVPEKTGKIEMGVKMDGDDHVKFYVKDNGIGIPKEKQGNLFKKFYQIDTSVKRRHRGSGLGLSICKGIVEGLGGKIWIESTEGLGTIAYFTIPRGDTT
jgi:PAS domain S-box-containing protein